MLRLAFWGWVLAFAALGCGAKTSLRVDEASGGSGAGGSGGSPACDAEKGITSPCAPSAPECNADSNPCLAVHEVGGAPRFDLRVAQLTILAPEGLTNPVVSGIIDSSVAIDLAQCDQLGDGTFSWLLSFDAEAGTFTTGVADPTSNPLLPYSYTTASLEGIDAPIPVAPSTGGFSLGDACDLSAGPVDVNLYFALGVGAPEGLLLPLRSLRLTGAVTSERNCIGEYSVQQCDDPLEPRFTPGAKARALIALADADNFMINSLAQTLCVLLTGESGPGTPMGKRCPKDANGVIQAKGDACLATLGPATDTCADALFFEADLAASGVQVAP